ncbi:hypothetical protein RYX36_022374 [Vicia faba]
MQWPALMQALALRPGGPHAFRLTGIGPPASDNSDHLQQLAKEGLNGDDEQEGVLWKFRDRQQHWTVLNNSIAGIIFEWFGQALARIWQFSFASFKVTRLGA